MEIEAHLALLEDLVGAGPERKELPNGFHRAPQRLRRRVRAEILRAVVLHAARIVDARKLLVDRQLQIKVVLVVFEPDNEAGPIVLDEVALEDERFHLVGGCDELEISCLADELGDTRGLRVAGCEVRAKAAAKTQGLADVNDLALVVPKQVYARSVGHGPQASFDRLFE